MGIYATAESIATEARKLLDAGDIRKRQFPSHRTGVDRYCIRHNVPYREEKAAGGRGGVTRHYLLSSIPGFPNPLREAFALHAVSKVAKAGVKAAREQKEEVARSAEEDRTHTERCLQQFNALPLPRQTAAKAKYELLRACEEFLKGGGYKGRVKEGRKTWSTCGVQTFLRIFKTGKLQLEKWVVEELARKGETSLCYRTITSWRDSFESDGLYGLADKYISKMESSLSKDQRDFVEACICDHPHISGKKLHTAMEARFAGEEIPSVWSIIRYVKKWKKINASRYLFLTNPDEWKNKYMFAVGDASEEILKLNQVWEADSTPGDIMLLDGRHTVIGIIDVWPRRARFLVSPTSKAAAVQALFRRCFLEWGQPDVAKTDNGADYTANLLVATFDALDIYHKICKPFCPEEKPHIERVLQTMSHGIVELLPGYIGHNVADRKAIEARKSFAKRLMTKGETVEVKLTSVDFQKILDRWTDAMYMQDTHEGLGGKTPAAMVRSWREPVKKIGNERALDLLLMPAPEDGGLRYITKKGIRVTYGAAILDYSSPGFAGHEGERVLVKPDLADLGHAVIYRESGEFLCWAEDPSWYGISRAEAASHLKAKQKQLIQEGTKELRVKARKLKTKDLAFEILEHREAKLRAESANVTEFPKRPIDFTTPALEEAARALDIRDNGPVPSTPPPSPEHIAMKAQIQAELDRRAKTNIVGLAQETARQRYKRWKGLKEELMAGVTITEQDYSFVVSYERSSECQGFLMVETDLGSMTK